MKNPLFSIILPVYNVSKYLRPCIESILSQTYKNYEIILVDDGSTDNSPKICDEYVDSNACVHVIHKLNGGQSTARNVGLDIAIGEYIYFMDSDDYLIDEQMLEKIENCITKSHNDIVAFKFIKWFESDGHIEECTFNYQLSVPSNDYAEVGIQLTNNDAFYNAAWCKVVKRSLLLNNNIKFQIGIVGEDNDWGYQVAYHAKTISLIAEPLYGYRQRAGSVTRNTSSKPLVDMLWIIDKWDNIIREEPANRNCEVIRQSLSKIYCNTIITFSKLSNNSIYYPLLKKHKYLLYVGRNRRVVLFRWIISLIGLKGLIAVLKRM